MLPAHFLVPFVPSLNLMDPIEFMVEPIACFFGAMYGQIIVQISEQKYRE